MTAPVTAELTKPPQTSRPLTAFSAGALPPLLARGALYARTLAHLHPAQIAFRPLNVARSRLLSASPRLAALAAGDSAATLGSPLLALSGTIPTELPGMAPELERATRALNGEQRLVGQTLRFDPPRTDFSPAAPKLVVYQQAYLGIARSLAVAAHSDAFADAEKAVRLAVAHIREFVERVPPGTGFAWDPYPVAMRIINVLVARELLRPLCSDEDAAFLDGALLHALAQHARWLSLSLEFHLLGNHLFTDGVALYLAGCAVETSASVAWRAMGQTIITRSLALDVLPDGGHVERSPMYQALYLDQLELVLCAARALGVPAPAGAASLAQSLARFLLATAHPDGDIPLLGDSAFDEAPTPADLAGPLGLSQDSLRARLYGRLASETPSPDRMARQSFPDSGLQVIRTDRDFLVLDAGPLGSRDLPGHAHADALSFELSHAGRRFIIDAGAGHYENDDRRAYFRGPLAHSSVSVDGHGSDEVWQVWRAARRAEVDPVIHTFLEGVHVLRGSVRSAWGWRQSRLLIFAPSQVLCVLDRIDNTTEGTRVASHIHFAPDVSVDPGANGLRIRQGETDVRLVQLVGHGWSIHQGETSPFRGWTAFRMGEFEPAPEVELEASSLTDCWGVAWALLFGAGADVRHVRSGIELELEHHLLSVAVDGGLRWELRRR
jgi:hypothetical protein